MQQNYQEQNTQCNKMTKNKTHNATKLPYTKNTMQQNDQEQNTMQQNDKEKHTMQQNTQCNKMAKNKTHNAAFSLWTLYFAFCTHFSGTPGVKIVFICLYLFCFIKDVNSASYGLSLQRWFRKCFYEMETPGKEGVISFQELKKFMQKVNYKVSASALKDKFTVYDTKKSGEIFFDDFCSMFQDLVFSQTMFSSNFSR